MALLAAAFAAAAAAAPARPHIILMALDDVGWADISYRGSDFPTPNIDGLIRSGVLLDRYYVQPVCSPTRSAFMTGRYPFHTGMQHITTLVPGTTAKLPLDVPTAAELMRDAGYETHMVGKWHLGYAKFGYTPVGRGFQSYTGYLQGQTDYYNHTVARGLDYWDNTTGALAPIRQDGYSMSHYTSAAERIISNLAPGKSLFMYYAHQEIHIPIEYPPQSKYADLCSKVPKDVPSAAMNRQALCSMMADLDDQVGRFVELLKSKQMWSNTLMWVSTDNGGMTYWQEGFPASVSSNWPLRGGKTTLFEGGVRGTAFLVGGVLPDAARGTTVGALMHAVDILPTLAARAGVPAQAGWDGRDMWAQIAEGAAAEGPREIPLNILQGAQNFSGIIVGDMKLIVGAWGSVGTAACDGYWTAGVPYQHLPPPETDMPKLFNISADPQERTNLAQSEPKQLAALTAALARWADAATGFVEPQANTPHPRAFPALHKGVWAPFL